MKCEQTVVRRNQILTCTVLLGGGTNTRLRFYRQARTCISPALSVFSRGRHHPFPRLPSCHLDKGQDKKNHNCYLKKTVHFWSELQKGDRQSQNNRTLLSTPSGEVAPPSSLWRMPTLGSLFMWRGTSVTFMCGLTSSKSISPSERFPSWVGTPSNVTMNLGLTEFTVSLLVRSKENITNHQIFFLYGPTRPKFSIVSVGNTFIPGVSRTTNTFGVRTLIGQCVEQQS